MAEVDKRQELSLREVRFRWRSYQKDLASLRAFAILD